MADPYGILDAPVTAEELEAAFAPAPPGLYAEVYRPPGDDDCQLCGEPLRRGPSDLSRVCEGCGLVVEGDTAEPDGDEAPPRPGAVARLRIVGLNSSSFQPDLYRSCCADTSVSQRKQVYEELVAYRQQHIEAGGLAFPLNVCDRAAELYGAVQAHHVKRSQKKQAILAHLIYRACLELKFVRSKPEIAKFMQLTNQGIAHGENFVREMIADGKMDLEANVDPCRPEIAATFAELGLEAAKYDRLRDAVERVVARAKERNIGTSSILRSKVAGAAFVVLSRCRDAALLGPAPMSLQDFCGQRIRRNTVERFTRELRAYESHFADIYLEFGLSQK